MANPPFLEMAPGEVKVFAFIDTDKKLCGVLPLDINNVENHDLIHSEVDKINKQIEQNLLILQACKNLAEQPQGTILLAKWALDGVLYRVQLWDKPESSNLLKSKIVKRRVFFVDEGNFDFISEGWYLPDGKLREAPQSATVIRLKSKKEFESLRSVEEMTPVTLNFSGDKTYYGQELPVYLANLPGFPTFSLTKSDCTPQVGDQVHLHRLESDYFVVRVEPLGQLINCCFKFPSRSVVEKGFKAFSERFESLANHVWRIEASTSGDRLSQNMFIVRISGPNGLVMPDDLLLAWSSSTSSSSETTTTTISSITTNGCKASGDGPELPRSESRNKSVEERLEILEKNMDLMFQLLMSMK